LIGLGFKIDDVSFKKFNSSMGDADKATADLGDQLEGFMDLVKNSL